MAERMRELTAKIHCRHCGYNGFVIPQPEKNCFDSAYTLYSVCPDCHYESSLDYKDFNDRDEYLHVLKSAESEHVVLLVILFGVCLLIVFLLMGIAC